MTYESRLETSYSVFDFLMGNNSRLPRLKRALRRRLKNMTQSIGRSRLLFSERVNDGERVLQELLERSKEERGREIVEEEEIEEKNDSDEEGRERRRKRVRMRGRERERENCLLMIEQKVDELLSLEKEKSLLNGG